MDKLLLISTGTNDAMFFHLLIFLFGHSIVEEIENNSVEVNKSDLLSLYNYLVINYRVEYSFIQFKENIENQDKKLSLFLSKTLSLEIKEK